VGAVSPPGGDFSEPVTQNSMRVAGGFWALDSALAYSRHYPSVNWNMSYSLYFHDLDGWFEENAPSFWRQRRQEGIDLLQKDTELQEIVQLVGPDALQDQERLVLEVSRMVKEVFLQQNAFSDDDAYSSLEKTGHLLDTLMVFNEECKSALDAGVSLATIMANPIREEISRLREVNSDGFVAVKEKLVTELKAAIQKMAQEEAA